MAVIWKKLAYEDDVILESFMAAKGDLISASADDTPLILSVGANDLVLTADDAEATGLKWAAAGTGDVTAAAVIADHTVVRGDGGAKGIQDSGVTIDDADNVTAINDLTFGGTLYVFDAGGETIVGDGTDLTITSGGAINLTATTDVVIPANIGITFGTGEKIEGDDTDLTITSGAKINLSAASDVILPVNIGLILGDGAEKIESDNTNLTINSGVDINLTATDDINVPANVGITFGDDGEKIEGDGTNLTIASSGTLSLNSTGAITASYQGIADNAVVTVDGSPAATELALWTASGLDGATPAAVAATMALDDIGVPDAAVDFDLQQATDLVVMTVANEAALPAANIAVGQLCFCTGELSLHICTSAA